MDLNEKSQKLINKVLSDDSVNGLNILYKYISESNLEELEFKTVIDKDLNEILEEEEEND